MDDSGLNFGAPTVLERADESGFAHGAHLEATGADNLFVVIGEPELEVEKIPAPASGRGDPWVGRVCVKVINASVMRCRKCSRSDEQRALVCVNGIAAGALVHQPKASEAISAQARELEKNAPFGLLADTLTALPSVRRGGRREQRLVDGAGFTGPAPERKEGAGHRLAEKLARPTGMRWAPW